VPKPFIIPDGSEQPFVILKCLSLVAFAKDDIDQTSYTADQTSKYTELNAQFEALLRNVDIASKLMERKNEISKADAKLIALRLSRVKSSDPVYIRPFDGGQVIELKDAPLIVQLGILISLPILETSKELENFLFMKHCIGYILTHREIYTDILNALSLRTQFDEIKKASIILGTHLFTKEEWDQIFI